MSMGGAGREDQMVYGENARYKREIWRSTLHDGHIAVYKGGTVVQPIEPQPGFNQDLQCRLGGVCMFLT